MYLLLTECHQNDRDEEVEHHKSHKHNAGANEECTKYWIVVKNLRDNKAEIGIKNKTTIIFCSWYWFLVLYLSENGPLRS